MSWKKFFNNYKYRLERFFNNQDPDHTTKLLISMNLGVYFAWQVTPGFMFNHFVMNEVNTIRNHKYYTVITSAFSHKDFLPMFFNSLTLWFFARPLTYSIGGTGVMALYITGAIFDYIGLYYKYKYQYRGYAIPSTSGATASVSAILTHFILRNPWETIFLFIFPVPAILAGLFMLYMSTGARENHSLYGACGGGAFYLLSCHCITEQSTDQAVEVEEVGKSKLLKPVPQISEMTFDIPCMPFSSNIAELPISQTVLSIYNSLPPFTYDTTYSSNINWKTLKLSDNSVYQGEYLENLPHGNGIQVFEDGSLSEGQWKNGKLHGICRVIYSSGDYYQGYFNNGKVDGLGILVSANGARYEGQWHNEKQHGMGREIWPDGSEYSGEFRNGCKWGQGIFKWNDGGNYTGEFFKNNIHGKGNYQWADGRSYVGDWIDNKMQGFGKFTWPDKRTYEGEYFADKRHGQGIMVWGDGKVYNGTWSNGKKHGIGVKISKKGKRQGEWNNGKRIRWVESPRN